MTFNLLKPLIMKTLYIKGVENYPNKGTFLFYWKLTELEGKCVTVEVTSSKIDVFNDDSFDDEINFITETTCEGKYRIIKREEFDKFYIQTVQAINDAINLENDYRALEDEEYLFGKKLLDDIDNFLNT